MGYSTSTQVRIKASEQKLPAEALDYQVTTIVSINEGSDLTFLISIINELSYRTQPDKVYLTTYESNITRHARIHFLNSSSSFDQVRLQQLILYPNAIKFTYQLMMISSFKTSSNYKHVDQSNVFVKVCKAFKPNPKELYVLDLPQIICTPPISWYCMT